MLGHGRRFVRTIWCEASCSPLYGSGKRFVTTIETSPVLCLKRWPTSASISPPWLVAAQTSGAAASPSFVPVATEEGQKELAAKSYERYLSADDDFTQFLRVIHRTLKASKPA